ncbi:gamma-glutamyltransferase family protein [Streptomyces bohaiensis]|uniref:Gamma-glutamyltransferase family protein n=1 Tax=Streptomyces bohaiensis TaxID=1431344 RepID=A0ABX1CBR8_9ACTN|nr:gamma-glutamyltransferase [Streptomyces bohaiensis]NJQ14647.1 gamma-glutamyltransferase family protein [Streptomyces bohaiensis]
MTTRPELRGTFGAVSSTHWLASAAGMATLEAGGNAFDAAAAAGFVLQVVEPHLNGPAGDVPILFFDAASGRVQVICGQGPMPRAATPAAFRALDLHRIPGSGLLPATVPGAFGAWLKLLEHHGTLRLAQVLRYAVGYAADGYPVLPKAAEAISILAELFRDHWPESGRTYLVDGAPPVAGSRLRNPALADTYRRVLKEAGAAGPGREQQIRAAHQAFYGGFVAEAIDAHLRTDVLDATGRRHRGLLDGDDLAHWEPRTEDTVSRAYRGLEVHKPGPWSQGPVFLQQLALLEGFDLAAMGLDGADHLHTVIECAKLAYADREAWYGDPDFTDVPLDTLLSDAYAADRRRLVGDRASDRLRPGAPDGRAPRLLPPDRPEPPDGPPWQRQVYEGLPTVVPPSVAATEARGDTCCLTVTDRHGNMVAATPSGGWLKSSPVIPGLGFPLGTRGQMAWLEEGHPNSLAPGKRPRTTLSPTLVVREGRARLAFGTPGGDQQDQWTLGFFLAHADFGLDLQQAVETLAFHSEHVPSSFTPRTHRPLAVRIEGRRAAEAAAELARRGHVVVSVPDWSLGKVCAVGAGPDDGLLRAAASPRGGQAYAIAR